MNERLKRRDLGPRGRRTGILFLVALAVLACHSCSDDTPEHAVRADLILTGGSVFTGVAGKDLQEAIALRGNVVLAVGDSEAVLGARGPQTIVVDLDGRSVVPGFHDAHIHLYYGALSSLGPNLLFALTKSMVLSEVQRYADLHPDRDWILGSGWYFDILPGGSLPSKHDLDKVAEGKAVALSHISGHYLWVNSEALRRAGIDSHTPDPPGGSIGRDPESGEPNGLLFETATGLVYDLALANIPSEVKKQALRETVRELGKAGVTSVQTILTKSGVSGVDLSSYLELHEEGALTCRVNLFLSGELDQETILYWKERLTGRDLRLAGLKVFVDGNFQGHTAWLLEPYADQPGSTGTPIHAQEELDEIAAKAQCLGLPVKFHAIGDAAVRHALDAIEAARSACSPIQARHSVEHVELLDPEDLDRFSTLGAVATVQPVTALFSTTPLFSSTPAAVGPERTGRLFPNRSLKQSGVDVVLSTDWPAVPFVDPLVTIWASLVRGGESSAEFGLPSQPQAFTLEEALSAYTLLPARAMGLEDVLGTLEKGKLADLVVLSRDIFSLPRAGLLRDVRVDMTVLDGRIIYQRGS